MVRSKYKKEWEPDPDMLCEQSGLLRYSKDDAEIINCEKLADYRVLVFLDTQTLCEGGIASNPDDWENEVKIEYWCAKHFREIYHSTTSKTPKMSFRKVERP